MKKPATHKRTVKLSVIIPCYNGAATIADQLEVLANQEWSEPWEIIVANNGSTDASMDIVARYKERLPNLRIVDASARPGQPYALNVGARAARGEALVFCDADDEVAAGWLAAMGAALAKYDFVASRFETRKLTSPKFYRKQSQEDGLQQSSSPPYLPFAGGCGLGVKRSLYEAVDGFDETLLFLHDTDFCFRLQMFGTKLRFVPDAVIHIRSRNSFTGLYRQSKGYSEYNILMSKKQRALGVPKLSGRELLHSWLYSCKELARCFLQIGQNEGLINFIWRLGGFFGRLKGCTKYRVLA